MLAMIYSIDPHDAYYAPTYEGVTVGSVIEVSPTRFRRSGFHGPFTVMEGKNKGNTYAALSFELIPYLPDASEELIGHLTAHNKTILEAKHV